MPIIFGSNPLGEAFARASEKARQKTIQAKKDNTEVIGQCCKCEKDIYFGEKLYHSKGRYYCETHKTPKAKECHVFKGFGFPDVQTELKAIEKDLNIPR